MTLPFIDRAPTFEEIERLRLILSTYQDGTGMNDGGKKPGWRDFERSLALALNGVAQESKYIFDVLLTEPKNPSVKYGLSCKMGNQLTKIRREKRAFMELSNSAKKFWDHLNSKGIYQNNYKKRPEETGRALLQLVKIWHEQESRELGGSIDISKSYYLTLSYNKLGWYQLHQFALDFPEPANLYWHFPIMVRNGKEIIGNLRADDENGRIFEWYGESGGQLKYFPQVTHSIWASSEFQLETLPSNIEDSLLAKVKYYFPKKWIEISNSDTDKN